MSARFKLAFCLMLSKQPMLASNRYLSTGSSIAGTRCRPPVTLHQPGVKSLHLNGRGGTSLLCEGGLRVVQNKRHRSLTGSAPPYVQYQISRTSVLRNVYLSQPANGPSHFCLTSSKNEKPVRRDDHPPLSTTTANIPRFPPLSSILTGSSFTAAMSTMPVELP